jgi:hypothetical protein
MKALRSVKISLANIRYFYRRAGIHRRSSLATALGVFERNETRAAWAATIRQLWGKNNPHLALSRRNRRQSFTRRQALQNRVISSIPYRFAVNPNRIACCDGDSMHRIVNAGGEQRGLEQAPGGKHPFIDRSTDSKHGLVHHLAQSELHRDTA